MTRELSKHEVEHPEMLDRTVEALLIYLSLFGTSNLARYHPRAWFEIASGIRTAAYHRIREDIRDLPKLSSLTEWILRPLHQLPESHQP